MQNLGAAIWRKEAFYVCSSKKQKWGWIRGRWRFPMKVSVALPRETGTINIGDLQLESGEIIQEAQLAYERVGSAKNPTILICHALTGTQEAVGEKESPGYWAKLIKPGGYINLDDYQVLSFNVIGGCNGSTGPLSINPKTGKPYQSNFPFITVRDMVNAQYQALHKMKISHLKAIIGGSLGGMQVLEWGIMYPDKMDALFPIAVTPFLNDYAIAFNTIARLAIRQDPNWNGGNYSFDTKPEDGLSLARMVGMVTYRTSELFSERFGREQRGNNGTSHDEINYEVESYLDYQGEKLTKRFDANSYLYLLRAMDTHDVGRGRGGWKQALLSIKARLHAVTFAGDLLFPTKDLEDFVYMMKENKADASLDHVDTQFGHDGFLVEFEKWGHLLKYRLQI
ncbi:homoserine O-acetyltransferase MetX [Aquibacillus kalidii]|uniref:homoserine O-acetyltransferase MetX n=1 Tax=Aquibacillus kalidii TaxID=2762597 RepID=UPI001F467015|nr:homoserine O-acetyltransferase [Aquibacillus kalidii]